MGVVHKRIRGGGNCAGAAGPLGSTDARLKSPVRMQNARAETCLSLPTTALPTSNPSSFLPRSRRLRSFSTAGPDRRRHRKCCRSAASKGSSGQHYSSGQILCPGKAKLVNEHASTSYRKRRSGMTAASIRVPYPTTLNQRPNPGQNEIRPD